MIPYLCGGTFLTQLLRVTERTTTPTDRLNGQKESLPEQEVFRRLLSIYHLRNFIGGEGKTLKTYASRFKSCADSLRSYTNFTDSDCRLAFNDDVRSERSVALSMMSDFVADAVVSQKWHQIVRSVLGLIVEDESILPDERFFIMKNFGWIRKCDIADTHHFYIEPILLGTWHYIIMNRAEDNEKGAETYKAWYPAKDVYRGTVGNALGTNFTVESLPKVNTPPKQKESVSDADPEEGTPDAKQEETIDSAQGQTVNNFFDIKIKNNIQGNVIQNLNL